MCGLFGFSGNRPVDLTKLRWLAYSNESRGKDSIGLYTKKPGVEGKIIKNLALSSIFIKGKPFVNAVNGATVVVGHTRAATSGTVTLGNAHPFQYGDLVGAHNGFLLPELIPDMKKTFGLTEMYSVDSQVLVAALDNTRHGNGGVVDITSLSKMEGAITATFTDVNAWGGNTIILYRREARPLHVGFSEEGIYYSSECEPLELIGCLQVILLASNSAMVIRDGRIVSYTLIDKPRFEILPQDRLTGWHKRFKADELTGVPIVETTHTYSTYNKCSGDNYKYWDSYPDYTETNYFTKSEVTLSANIDKEKLVKFEKTLKSSLQSSKLKNIKKIDPVFSKSIAPTNVSIVLITCLDSEKTYKRGLYILPPKNWTVGVVGTNGIGMCLNKSGVREGYFKFDIYDIKSNKAYCAVLKITPNTVSKYSITLDDSYELSIKNYNNVKKLIDEATIPPIKQESTTNKLKYLDEDEDVDKYEQILTSGTLLKGISKASSFTRNEEHTVETYMDYFGFMLNEDEHKIVNLEYLIRCAIGVYSILEPDKVEFIGESEVDVVQSIMEELITDMPYTFVDNICNYEKATSIIYNLSAYAYY